LIIATKLEKLEPHRDIRESLGDNRLGKDESHMTEHETTSKAMDPSSIMQVGLGFWASKTLLAAAKLGLFTLLDGGPKTPERIRGSLGLHGEHILDFLDALHSLGFLEREGVGPAAKYGNTRETAAFLVRGKPQYIGGFLEMVNDREYRFWADLEEGLRTGEPQNEIKATGEESFAAIYQDPARLRQFTEAMSSIQIGAFVAFAERFDFSKHQLLLDVGGSGATLSSLVALRNPHMRCISYDLPALEPLAKEAIARFGVASRVSIQNGDFFAEQALPKADLVTMGNILHSFDLPKKKSLLRKAYDALPDGGELVVIELILDDERRRNTMGLLMSLNMLIESDGGFNFTQTQFETWCREAGFREVRFQPLTGPTSAAIALK
jgi:O-methyltransferase domain/Dimerisation domain